MSLFSSDRISNSWSSQLSASLQEVVLRAFAVVSCCSDIRGVPESIDLTLGSFGGSSCWCGAEKEKVAGGVIAFALPVCSWSGCGTGWSTKCFMG